MATSINGLNNINRDAIIRKKELIRLTVKELIEKLSQFDGSLPVKLEYDASYYEFLNVELLTDEGETFIGIG